MSHITSHAISRYRKRVESLPARQVEDNLDTPTIRLAIRLGCCSVKLPNGNRAIIADGKIVTVLGKPRKHRTGKHMRGRPMTAAPKGEAQDYDPSNDGTGITGDVR